MKILLPIALIFFGLVTLGFSIFVTAHADPGFNLAVVRWIVLIATTAIGVGLLALGVYFAFRCFSEK